jgi:lipopolysaccharide transport system ATP-binding protein
LLLDEGKLKAFCSPKDVTDLYLDKLYKSFQDVIKLPVNNKILVKENIPLDFQDMRRDFINSTCLRNDIEVIEILQNKNSFGTGACSIENVSLEDYHGRPLSWIVGGEIVKLKIISHTLVDTPMLLFGFIVKDRLGQNLFGDNSHLSFIDNPLKSKKNEFWIAQFTFRMPVLPRGDYSIDVAVGNGIQENSIIHQWIHDAFIFRSHTSSSHMGLIGIPMLDISANLAQIPNHQ